MTYEEVKNRLTDIVGNPDTAQEKAVVFLSDLETDYTTLDNMAKKVSEQENRIRDLQDTNQKLFLSVTGTPEPEPEEPEPGIDWDKILTEEN